MDYIIDESVLENSCTPITLKSVSVTYGVIRDDFFSHIYNGNVSNNRVAAEEIKQSTTRTVAFYTTDASLDAKIVFRNNLITNTIYVPNITSFGYKFGLINKQSAEEARRSRIGVPVGEAEGIYCVEKYTIQGKYSEAKSRREILEYLKITNDLEFDTESVANSIKTNVFSSDAINKLQDSNIYVVHYIPKSLLVQNGSIYSNNLDVLITIKDVSNPANPIRHPWSENQIKADTLTKLNSIKEPFAFTLNITNNENVNKKYYYKSGNQIVTINSTVNNLTPDGFNYRIITNDHVAKEVSGSLEDLPSIGVYTTRDECEYNGDPSLKLNFEKLENDIATIKHARDKAIADLDLHKSKVELEKNKIESEKVSLERKSEAEKLKYEEEAKRFEEYREKHEMTLKESSEKHKQNMLEIETKHEHELRMMELKYEDKIIDMENKREQHDLAKDKMVLDMRINMLKAKFDMAIIKLGSIRNDRMNRKKHEMEMSKLKIDTYGKLITNLTGFVKTVLK